MVDINKTISPLVDNQFPAIYREESPLLVAFMKSYYEWAEQDENFIQLSRSIFEIRDIDTTLAKYGEYFRSKYLSSLPNIFADQIIQDMIQTSGRFMVKHVLDLYRSKGTERGYKILFRALYNNDVEFYYPGRHLLRASDGVWETPQYIEVAYEGDLSALEGRLLQIINKADNYALCDRAFKITVGNTESTVLLLKNVYGSFTYGEIIHPVNNLNALARIVGSLTSIQIISGGGEFTPGDILNIQSSSGGIEGLGVVRSTINADGGVTFNIVDGGYGYSLDSIVSVVGDGTGATFKVATLSNTQIAQIFSDKLIDYANTQLAVFGLAKSGSVSTVVDQSNVIGSATLFTSEFTANDIIYIVGNPSSKRIVSITNNTHMTVNNAFTSTVTSNNIVRVGDPLGGTVSVVSGESNVVGVGTTFTSFFTDGDLIKIANQTIATVFSVTNNTLLTTTTTFANTLSANVYYKDYAEYSFPTIATSRDFFSTRLKFALDVKSATIGKITSLTKINPGTNYTTNPTVSVVEPGVLNMRIVDGAGNFWGNNAVITGTSGNIDGIITSIQVIDSGFGYKQGEEVILFSNSNPSFIGIGISNISKIGKKQGYWKNNNGFLNSDKYLIDSYYFQEFSYELQTEKDISIWGSVINGSIHQAGTKMFGKVVFTDEDPSPSLIVDNVIEQV